MSGFAATIQGNDKVLLRLQRMRATSTEEFATSLEAVLTPAFEESKRLCPVDTTALVNSAHMEVTTAGAAVLVEISYGDYPTIDYAWFVHERLDLHHAPPTQAKFLETPMRAILPDLSMLVAADMRKFLQ